jgi:hypothetical protein
MPFFVATYFLTHFSIYKISLSAPASQNFLRHLPALSFYPGMLILNTGDLTKMLVLRLILQEKFSRDPDVSAAIWG